MYEMPSIESMAGGVQTASSTLCDLRGHTAVRVGYGVAGMCITKGDKQWHSHLGRQLISI